MPFALVVCGVSGCGKTSLGRALSTALSLPFQDADDFHSVANREKMSSGVPLTDADREPWLNLCAEWLLSIAAHGGILACSALRKRYRDVLTKAAPALVFVYIATTSEGDETVLAARLKNRPSHFFSASLLSSQLATVEPPTSDERAILIPISSSIADAVDATIATLNDAYRC